MMQGQRVRITEWYGGSSDKPVDGHIIGSGFVTPLSGSMTPVYMVELDEGLSNKDGTIFCSVIPVHRDCLAPIE
jgi:hypothetical protein